MNGGSGSGVYRSEDEYEDYGHVGNGRSGQFLKSNAPAAAGSMATVELLTAGTPGSSGVGGSTQSKVEHGISYGSAPAAQPGPTGAHRPGGVERGNICCLLDDGRRCGRPAGNASYSKRVQKTVFYKRLRLDVDSTAQHTYICDHHKNIIQTARVRVKKESDDEGGETEEVPDVDLYQLQVNTLRRYKKHFKISTRPGLNKAQLAEILTKHFKTIPVDEKEVITYFIHAVKSRRNKPEGNQPPSSTGGTGSKEDYDRY